MSDKEIDIEKLKKEAEGTYAQVEKTVADFEEKLTSLDMVSFPQGFKLRIRMDSMPSLHDNAEKSFSIMIEDKNRKEGQGRPKYFWNMDESLDLTFESKKLVNYKANVVSGGYNSNEYGNHDNPEIDFITTCEMMHQINGTYLNLMKEAKNNPQLFNEFLDEYTIAKKNHSELRSVINKEQNRINDVERSVQVENIKDVFKPVSQELVESFERKLDDSKEYNPTISIVTMNIPNMSYQKDMMFEKMSIRCTHGDNKKTFSVKADREEGFKRIKGSDAKELLKSSIAVNGNYVRSISNLVDNVDRLALSNLVEDKNRGYSSTENHVSVPIAMMSEICKDISNSATNELDKMVKSISVDNKDSANRKIVKPK
jgi:hypothetical protein